MKAYHIKKRDTRTPFLIRDAKPELRKPHIHLVLISKVHRIGKYKVFTYREP